MSAHESTGHSSIKTYLAVFGALAVLTGLTVVLSYVGLSAGQAVSLAILIASAKCLLIATFFMHLRTERKVIHYTVYAALFLVIVLIGSLIPDIGFPS